MSRAACGSRWAPPARWRFDSDGDLAAVVDIPADFVSSISFRCTDVLITAVGALFRARSEVAGVPVADARI
jgi:hypothetical protein